MNNVYKIKVNENCMLNIVYFDYFNCIFTQRTSDGGNGNHSVSLPIILIKIKSIKCFHIHYISSLLVSIYDFAFNFLFP